MTSPYPSIKYEGDIYVREEGGSEVEEGTMDIQAAIRKLKDIPYVWDYMKEAELFQKVKVEEPPFIFRADGVSFKKYFKEVGEPRDELLHQALVSSAEELLKWTSCEEAYVSSDEVSVLCNHLLYAGRVEKIVSVFSSFLGAQFSVKIAPLPPGWFDGRIVKAPWKPYLKWRLKVTLCNYASLKTKEPCSRALIRLRDVPTIALGTLIRWEIYEKEGYNPITNEKVVVKRRRIIRLEGEDLLRAIVG